MLPLVVKLTRASTYDTLSFMYTEGSDRIVPLIGSHPQDPAPNPHQKSCRSGRWVGGRVGRGWLTMRGAIASGPSVHAALRVRRKLSDTCIFQCRDMDNMRLIACSDNG